jgi:TPR repeat protein
MLQSERCKDLFIGSAERIFSVRKKMGENITSEWLRDAEAAKVWDALQLVRRDPESGIAALLGLADKDSSLALMFAGNIYSKGEYGINQDVKKGKALLSRAFDLGSIEGGFILAHLLMSEASYKDGLQIYEKLSSLNYAPAKYALGYHYCFGEVNYRDLKRGLKNFENGSILGHLPSKKELANQSIIQHRRYADIIRGSYLNLNYKFFSYYLKLTYPHSDRLRV